jgi:hypothetical protein
MTFNALYTILENDFMNGLDQVEDELKWHLPFYVWDSSPKTINTKQFSSIAEHWMSYIKEIHKKYKTAKEFRDAILEGEPLMFERTGDGIKYLDGSVYSYKVVFCSNIDRLKEFVKTLK